MPKGYLTNGKPDVAWWLSQIKAGEFYRNKCLSYSEWDKWRSYYRGNWVGDVLPVNVFFQMVRTIIPRIYFRNPSVSISPDKPGLMNMAFAQVLERVDNKLLRSMNFKREAKRAVQKTFMFGAGPMKVGFGGEYTPAPIPGIQDVTLAKGGMEYYTEYRQDVHENRPWIASLHTDSVIYPAGLDVVERAPWIGHKVRRPLEDVKGDRRLINAKNLTATETIISPAGMIDHAIPEIDLYEIRDARTRRVFVISPDANDPLNEGKAVLFDGPDTLQLNNGFPIHLLTFNPDDQYVWGVPDSRILEPYQLDANETNTQIMKHRRTALIKILVQRGGMREEVAETLVDSTISPVVWTEGSPNQVVKLMQQGEIPIDLFQSLRNTQENIRETVGFSRNQAGEFRPGSSRTTATEVNVVQQASEIRVDERRDAIADMMMDVIEQMHTAMFLHWSPRDVVEIVGPGGAPVWIDVSTELLSKGRYNIKVDPDTSVPETRNIREQRAMLLYEKLKTNPLIDPLKLTQYLLHELHGVQFDDMMKALPEPDQGVPDKPISAAEFAGLIGNSVSQFGTRPNAARNVSSLLKGVGNGNASV